MVDKLETTAYTEIVVPFPDLAMQALEEELAKTCHWWLSRRDIRERLRQCWRDCRNGLPVQECADACRAGSAIASAG